ncbi:MAG: T9SS type A sorting domain-containing protein [Saprospiraceae bacterium]|nr:T9SS type A sorting domain-containing protein [Saprospiraceae bacterium]
MNFRKPYLVFLLTFFCLGAGFSQNYSKAKVYAKKEDLGKLGVAVDHVHDGGSYIEGDFSRYELELAREAGFDLKIMEQDAELAYSKNRTRSMRSIQACIDALDQLDYSTPQNFTPGTYKGHYTYDQMLAELDKMTSLFPHLISKRQPIGDFQTEEGRPIEWLKISDNPGELEDEEPQMLFTALHHAREPVSMTQLIYFMWYILERYSTDSEIKYLLDNVELYFIPCVNPDGYVYNETIRPEGGGLWRKNRSDNGDGTFGVDLNRNYGHQWGYDNAGSSGASQSEVYRGPSPFSEPETQAVRSFVLNHNFKLALNYHAWGGFLVYPFGYTPQPAEDEEIFQSLGNLLTRESRYVYGTGLETIAYPTNGDADDWMYGSEEKQSIFSMTPEIGTEEHSFWPDEGDVEYLCQLSLNQNLSAAFFLLNSAMIFDESESYLTEVQGQLPFSITKLGFEDVAFAVKFKPVTPNIEFESPSKLYILDLFRNQKDNLRYTLSPGIQDGERIKISYTIDNGSFSHTDTIIKYYRNSRFLLNNPGNNSDWITNTIVSQWDETDKEFISEPTSLTDSPNGNTIPYTKNYLTLKNPVFISNGDSAVLSFRAFWDIQNQFDFMLVEISTDGNNFSPLCGRYSVAGRLNINKDLPIYTGRQLKWIIERIDLSEYVGEEVTIRFLMQSTKDDTRDGIYLDDIRILEYNQGDITSSNELQKSFESILYPNPANYSVQFESMDQDIQEGLNQIEIINNLGQTIYRNPVSDRTSVDISSWSPGLYFYRLLDQQGNRTAVKKLVINR